MNGLSQNNPNGEIPTDELLEMVERNASTMKANIDMLLNMKLKLELDRSAVHFQAELALMSGEPKLMREALQRIVDTTK